jgi:hypothetical protein
MRCGRRRRNVARRDHLPQLAVAWIALRLVHDELHGDVLKRVPVEQLAQRRSAVVSRSC